MFCIAAFIVLVFLGIVSAKYRYWLRKAWHCMFRRVTFRACDTSFKDEVKGRLLARVAVKRPQLVKHADIALEVAAFLVIVLTVWSLYVVAKSGLNLYVYGTCNPSNAASCSLGAEACSIDTVKPSFVESVQTWKVHEWFGNEFADFGKTVASVPARAQNWKAEEYAPANVSYYGGYDASKPVAVEVVDPGCLYCQQLFRNIKQAGFAERYNVTYVAYPIPNGEGGYKFPHSKLVVQYLEAVRLMPLEDAESPVDWQILERIFTGADTDNHAYQAYMNSVLTQGQVTALLDGWLVEFGYTNEQVQRIKTLAASEQVTEIMDANAKLVRDQIRTVKIPTIIYDGRRHDGVVKSEDL